MTTRAGFIRGLFGLAFAASVAIRGAAQDRALDTVWSKSAEAEDDFFTTQARYMAMAADLMAWQMDMVAKYNASLGREPFARVPSDETNKFVKWVRENT